MKLYRRNLKAGHKRLLVSIEKGIYRAGKYYVMSKISNKGEKSGKKCGTQKVKLKKGFNTKPTATAYLQIFGSGGGDTSPSVFLFADSQRYRSL